MQIILPFPFLKSCALPTNKQVLGLKKIKNNNMKISTNKGKNDDKNEGNITVVPSTDDGKME